MPRSNQKCSVHLKSEQRGAFEAICRRQSVAAAATLEFSATLCVLCGEKTATIKAERPGSPMGTGPCFPAFGSVVIRTRMVAVGRQPADRHPTEPPRWLLIQQYSTDHLLS
jgi:hypothetical protein